MTRGMLSKRSRRLAGGSETAERHNGPSSIGAPIVDPEDDLPYTVELWDLSRIEVERVLGRANSAALAQAILVAATTEHLGRRITLRKGDELIADQG